MIKGKIIILAVFSLCSCFFAGCKEETPLVSLGIDDFYRVYRMQKLYLNPALTGGKYVWTVNGDTVARTRDYIFMEAAEGLYHVSFDISDSDTPFHYEFEVEVLHEEIEYSPYISRVYEYCPAPGQFINEMPKYEPGDTYEDMRRKAEECISGTTEEMISLGAFGGYVTFGFDHTVINVPGEYDFRIWGNSFYDLTDPEGKGGSSEPGIVMVSYDRNMNGIPDDEWYELAGSEYKSDKTINDYIINYKKPNPGSIDGDYIHWTDSEGKTGNIPRNAFHSQSYWPLWLETEEMVFRGTRLADNAVDKSGTGTYFILYSYPWGYVDNHPNEFGDLNSFDISWAVDQTGNPVSLPGVDFIRVYTAINQCCGWLGETSTELSKAVDLHIAKSNLNITI